MMIEVGLKPDTIRNLRHFPDDNQYLTSDGLRWRVLTRAHLWRPPTDVYEIDENIVVRVEVAGVREADFGISLDDRFLIIRGARSDVSERRAYYQMEIPFGEFSTEVELPSPVVIEKAEAEYRDGFLRITLPKATPQQIRINY